MLEIPLCAYVYNEYFIDLKKKRTFLVPKRGVSASYYLIRDTSALTEIGLKGRQEY